MTIAGDKLANCRGPPRLDTFTPASGASADAPLNGASKRRPGESPACLSAAGGSRFARGRPSAAAIACCVLAEQPMSQRSAASFQEQQARATPPGGAARRCEVDLAI
jgi:hypothetical protein